MSVKYLALAPLAASLLMLATACHPEPVLSADPELKVGGTIAGIVRLRNYPKAERLVSETRH